MFSVIQSHIGEDRSLSLQLYSVYCVSLIVVPQCTILMYYFSLYVNHETRNTTNYTVGCVTIGSGNRKLRDNNNARCGEIRERLIVSAKFSQEEGNFMSQNIPIAVHKHFIPPSLVNVERYFMFDCFLSQQSKKKVRRISNAFLR